MSFFRNLVNQKFQVILLVLGVFVILIAFFDITGIFAVFDFTDMSRLQIPLYDQPVILLYATGIVLIVVSLIVFFVESSTGWSWLRPVKVRSTDNSYIVSWGGSSIRAIYGDIRDYRTKNDSTSTMALPANEYFDDECINDKNSSLGAYMQKHFEARISEIQDLINEKLKQQSMPSREVEKGKGKFQQSYGVGESVFLANPLGLDHRIIIASVTQQRVKEGLQARISFVFQAIDEIYRVMAEKRLNKVFLPLLGSGHGGLRPEVALFSMVLAWGEILSRNPRPVQVNIVLFRANEEVKPVLNDRVVKRILRMAMGMFRP